MVLAHDPNHVQSLVALADYWLLNNDVERAEPLVERLGPCHVAPEIHLALLGQVLLQRGNPERALVAFRDGMAHGPSSPTTMLGMAKAHVALNERPIALCLLREVISATDDYRDAYHLLVDSLMPGPNYQEVLASLHAEQQPRTYLEIGVQAGKSIRLAGPTTHAVGVDPNPQISCSLPPSTQIFAETSDAFFEHRDILEVFAENPIELCFIDGLHTFDQALRDFINAEKYAAPNAVFLFHDCYPVEPAMTTREQATTFWAGDVWKVIPILKEFRPDLSIHTVRTAPTGLGLITGMDPSSTILEEQFDTIVETYMSLAFDYLNGNSDARLSIVGNEWPTIQEILPKA